MRKLALAVFPLLAASAQTPGSFSKDLYPVLERANCRACHAEGGLAAQSRLRFPGAAASAEEIEAFGRGLAVLVDRNHPDRSLLLNKPTNREKHTGGKLIEPGSPQEAALVSWIDHLVKLPAESLPGAVPATHGAAPPNLMRRLTHSQYNNTIRDLLGDQTRPADRFPPEDFVNGFKNQAAAQDVPPLLAESYDAAAERLARSAFLGGVDNNRLIPCKPRSASDADCRAKFIRQFGLKAFRRPLTSTEFGRYSALFGEIAGRTGEFLQGAQLAIEAMLQSPKFLFRVERASDGPWQAYERASRLSYFLWDTMPDEELFRAAASGELANSAGVNKQAGRMLNDPRAREALDEFVSQWLRFDLVINTVKDRSLYRQFTPELAVAMTEETRRLIADVVWNDRSFMEIFQSDYAFVSSDLASLYGLPAPANEFDKVTFPAGGNRAGLLGQAMFLTVTSKPGDTSPTIRGYFVREHFLCQQVPDPPPGTNSSLPPLTKTRPQTNRERMKEHMINATCSSCHNLMDPVGFGLEKFDAIGRHREKQKIVFEPNRRARNEKPVVVELEIDPRGTVEGIANSEFSSPKELGRVLAESSQCQECIVKQLFRYAFGRRESPAGEPIVREALEVFRNSRFRLKELMMFLSHAIVFEENRS